MPDRRSQSGSANRAGGRDFSLAACGVPKPLSPYAAWAYLCRLGGRAGCYVQQRRAPRGRQYREFLTATATAAAPMSTWLPAARIARTLSATRRRPSINSPEGSVALAGSPLLHSRYVWSPTRDSGNFRAACRGGSDAYWLERPTPVLARSQAPWQRNVPAACPIEGVLPVLSGYSGTTGHGG